jgi:hypothetical protein
MKKHLLFIILLCCTCIKMVSQENTPITYEGGVEAFGYATNEELPFWTYSNKYGRLNQETNGLVYAFAKADYALTPNSSLQFVASGVARDGIDPNIQRAELYLSFKNKWIDVTLGSKDFTDDTYELSSIRRNILFSSNTRALPGLLIQNAAPIKIIKDISFDAAIAHYSLNDDRYVEDTKVHYKKFFLNWDINSKSSLHVGLQHLVQWGGTSPDSGAQPDGFSDFIKVVFGRGGGEEANENDQINVLGNQFGSYSVTYKRELSSSFDLDVYYQTLFEDRSGMELGNFPDGVWGIQVSPKDSKLIQGLLYEYVQTISQGGRPGFVPEGGQERGGDNYFFNGTYRSGWTYEGRTIGLPFITINNTEENGNLPVNNRSVAHHIGVLGAIWKLDYTLKLTYLENLGTYRNPISPKDTFVYSYFQAKLPTEKYGTFSVEVGADFNEDRDTFFGGGLGYRYTFN